MIRRALVVSLLVAAAALSSCGRPVELSVATDAADAARWQALLGEHPLPEDVLPVHSDAIPPARTPWVLRLRRVVAPVMESAPGAKVLERTWLAPTVPLWETASPAATLCGAVPLGEVELPRAALPADGRYVSDPDYPLVEQLVLEFDPRALDLDGDDERLARLREWFAQIPAAADEAPDVSWIGAVGDLMVGRGVTELLDRRDGLDIVFGDVLPAMQEVDLLVGNLEGAVTVRGTPLEKTFTFRFHPRVLAALGAAGFGYLSIVNNHSYDYGEIGFLDSLEHLAASGIGTSGAGATIEEARRPYAATIPSRHAFHDGVGTPVRILSVGAYPVERSGFDGARQTAAGEGRPGVLWADARNPAAQRAALDAMREAFGPDTVDIVVVHGGAEWGTHPSASQQELYRSFVDAGADLVLGHHSHVVQGIEAYRGALIAYSLGNFVFPGMFVTDYGEESLLLRVGLVDGRVTYVEPLPVRIDHQVISLDPDGAVLGRFEAGTRALAGQ